MSSGTESGTKVLAPPILLLAAAGFLSSSAARIMDPLLVVIARDFSVSVPAVAAIIAAYTLPYGLCQIVIGPLGDRLGKLRIILIALCGYMLAAIACSLAPNLPTLTGMRVLAGVASAGLIPSCLAYLGDAIPYHQRQVAISRFLTGAVLAQLMAGPLGGLFGQTVGWRGVFLVLATCAACLAATLALRIGSLPDRRGGGFTSAWTNYLALAASAPAVHLLLLAGLDGIVMVGCFPFIAPWMTDTFGLSYGAAGLILAGFGFGALIYTRVARWLVASLGEVGMVLAGGTLMVIGMVLTVLRVPWQAMPVIEMMLGFGFFMLHSTLQARATELLPDARATSVAAFAFMLLIGQGIGALLFARLIDWIGYTGAFFVDAVGITALALLSAAALTERRLAPWRERAIQLEV